MNLGLRNSPSSKVRISTQQLACVLCYLPLYAWLRVAWFNIEKLSVSLRAWLCHDTVSSIDRTPRCIRDHVSPSVLSKSSVASAGAHSSLQLLSACLRIQAVVLQA